MFLSVIYPGVCFFIGAFFLSESPRWLFHKGRIEEAYRVCRRSLPEDEVRAEMAQMQELAAASKLRAETFGQGSLLQRKYVLPFVLACIVLAFTQASGINSILSYLVIILKQAGMSPAHAGQGDVLVKLLHCVITVVAIPLVDRRGRKFLLTLGTGGMILSLLAIAFLFRGIEAHHSDVRAQVESAISGNRLTISAASLRTWSNSVQGPVALTVLYSYGGGNKGASIASSESEALTLEPDARHKSAPLVIHQAVLGPVPAENMAWLAAFCLAVFVACHSIGPGVVVWLTLSELMPTRIRSVGMGIALVLNQGVSTLIAGVFLSVVSRYGYHVMFACCAACTVIYFITAAFYLPETKGKSLEEIERSFERP
jgi:MFS family permease